MIQRARIMLSLGLTLVISFSAQFAIAMQESQRQESTRQESSTRNVMRQDEIDRDEGPPQSITVSPQIQAMEMIRERMEQVKERFKAANTTRSTQALQLEVLGQLDQLIAEDSAAQQQASASQQTEGQSDGSSQQSESQPSPNESTGQGAGEQGATESAIENSSGVVDRAWGHLRDRVRVRMRSALSEEFLPKYEKLIEAYYKRLASADEDGP